MLLHNSRVKTLICVLCLSALALTTSAELGAADYDVSLNPQDHSGAGVQPDDIGTVSPWLTVMVKAVVAAAKVIQAIFTLLG